MTPVNGSFNVSGQYDILYCEGPGDIVAAYMSWKQGRGHSSETSLTFSGQVFEFCRLQCRSLCAISYCARSETIVDPGYVVMNLPRWRINVPKIGYDFSLFLYTLRLLLLALRIRPKVILVASGVTGWHVCSLLRLSGARLVPVLHNTLWPEGWRPSGPIACLRRWTYSFFWKRCVSLTLVVSLAARRQVEEVLHGLSRPILLFRPSFPAAAFREPPPPKDFNDRPFRVMFAGRIEEDKGVFDLLAIAQELQATSEGSFEFTICGDGSALAALRQQIDHLGLQGLVKVYGRLDRADLVARYLESHVVIVPTRTSFAEGYALVVAEAILMLRPVVTCSVVPAAEMLSAAVILASPNDVLSYVSCIEALSMNAEMYLQLVENARRLRPEILDNSASFLAILRSSGI